jgi:hypothetical protein
MLSQFAKASRGAEEDLEKAPRVNNGSETNSNELLDSSSDNATPGESFEYGNSTYAKIQRFAGKFNIEQRGVERVPESERTDNSFLNIGSMVGSYTDHGEALPLTKPSGWPQTWSSVHLPLVFLENPLSIWVSSMPSWCAFSLTFSVS